MCFALQAGFKQLLVELFCDSHRQFLFNVQWSLSAELRLLEHIILPDY